MMAGMLCEEQEKRRTSKRKRGKLGEIRGGLKFYSLGNFSLFFGKMHVGALGLTATVEMISSDHRGSMVYLTAITIHITLQLVVMFLKISLLQTTAYICFPNRAKTTAGQHLSRRSEKGRNFCADWQRLDWIHWFV